MSKEIPKNLLTADSVVKELEKYIAGLQFEEKGMNVGRISQLGDGVAEIEGLAAGMLGEMLDLGGNTVGLVLNLNKKNVGAVVIGPYTHLKSGDEVAGTGVLLSVPVGENLIGRTVDALGRPLDGKGEIVPKKTYPIEKIAPGIIERQAVSVPLATGIKAIDALTPVGRGQRQLIIGDRGIGKSAVALTTMINQKGKDMVCIYVTVGQKASFIAQTIETLDRFGAMEHTLIVAAAAADSAVMQYLAPYSGTAMAEYFMDQGKDVLIVYDDLSKHAWAYREISLLLKRPAGREAYPGDVFYLHSRLLERACRMSKELGGGSITALPIIETQEGDVSAYIPTNVISITDGQIYLEPDLFNADVRPAINVGLSVSRVGGDAQTKAMKQVSGKMRLELAQYREMAAFSQFASDLDEKTKKQLDRGARLAEILKQGWDDPYELGEQILVLWAATNGYVDAVGTEKVKEWEKRFVEMARLKHKKLIAELSETKDKITEKQLKDMEKMAEEFNKSFFAVLSS